MQWPRQRVEDIPSDRFVPPHCPRPDCRAHDPAHVAGRQFYTKDGFHYRKCDGRYIQRYQCKLCNRSFSQQSFATSYYLHRPELSEPIASQAVEGSCIRQIARHLEQIGLGCSKSTVAHHLRRIGRHSLLLHAKILCSLEKIGEPIVYDDFETFAHSLLYPLAGATAVGAKTKLWYYADVAQHRPRARLKGHRQARQRQLDETVGTVPPGEVARQFDRMLSTMLEVAHERENLLLVTDGAPVYQTQLAKHPGRERVVHEMYVNPERKERANVEDDQLFERDRAMSPNDQLHQLLRHCRAHNRRRTIAYSRRHNDHMLRDALTLVWRNFIKRSHEQSVDAPTPAMKRGLTDSRWTWYRVLAMRLFPSLSRPSERCMHFYRGEEITLPLPVNRRHQLKNAF